RSTASSPRPAAACWSMPSRVSPVPSPSARSRWTSCFKEIAMKHSMLALVAASLAATLGASTSALAEVVAVVNPKAAEASLTKDQVAQIFLGKSTAFAPIDQDDGAP